ncbi:hypothetical protein BVC80_9007g9 [Macleaya cordata]|uniref:Uncharacterized protein n=1 Tax=Macleaya cordata TaxID=56857 RepID=A0A200QLJ4_MACCD|nr:hypothetical protein BVC80_9007g9 [Macleaya cordata]
MGNCMEVCLKRQYEDEKINQRKHEDDDEKTHEEDEKQKPSGFAVNDEDGFEKSGFRVKIVLSKEELEWLLLQLGDHNKGGKRLKDILGEIEKGREKVQEEEENKVVEVWKPSLESIMESPEVHQMDI